MCCEWREQSIITVRNVSWASELQSWVARRSQDNILCLANFVSFRPELVWPRHSALVVRKDCKNNQHSTTTTNNGSVLTHERNTVVWARWGCMTMIAPLNLRQEKDLTKISYS